MPNYSYICKNDHKDWDFQQTWKTKKKSMKCKECGARSLPFFGFNTPPSSNYPYSSDAMGVSPEQIPEAAASLRDAGIATQFDSEGGLIVESQEHANKVMAHLGIFDRDACYNQRTPGGMDSIPDYYRDEMEGIEMPVHAMYSPDFD